MDDHKVWFGDISTDVGRASHLHYVHNQPKRLPNTTEGLTELHDDLHAEPER